MPSENTAPHLIRNGAIESSDDWTLLTGAQAELPADEKLIVSVALWQEHKAELKQREHIAVWLDSDEAPLLIADDLASFAFIAINFPVFSDGRGYSYARTLRQQYAYSGELRAIGDVLLDQLSYLHRCGFNAFELRADQDTSQAVQRLNDFSEHYQAAVIPDAPLYTRR